LAERTRLGYRPPLDGIRAVAIVAVVSLHTFGVPRQGALGVDLFFVLSGFLITTLLLEERRETGALSLRSFYRRRALRLLPGLFVLLLTYVAVTTVVLAVRGDLHSGHSREMVLAGAAAAVYGSNFLQLTHHVPLSLSHLWSLAEEEQFYLVWPVLLVVLARLRWALPRIVGALVALIALEGVILTLGGTGYLTLYLRPDTHAEPLLVGCLFGTWYVAGRLPRLVASQAERRWTGAIALALVVVGVFELYRLVPVVIYGTPVLTAFAAAAALLIVAVLHGDTAVARLLSVPPLLFLGRISYSLYLWHLPILVAFGVTPGHGGWRGAAAAATAVAIASASYYLVERRFLRLKYRRREAPETSLAPAPATS
jgi:peptidoglycan/LPS O-acetylase OafA/YrhL